jgi:UDP-glucose 4-epimerase
LFEEEKNITAVIHFAAYKAVGESVGSAAQVLPQQHSFADNPVGVHAGTRG